MGVINRSYDYEYILTAGQKGFLSWIRNISTSESYYDDMLTKILINGKYKKGDKINLNALRDVYLEKYNLQKRVNRK